MVFDFAAEKLAARGQVHETLSVAATYLANEDADPVDIKVRWHNKLTLMGDIENMGYAQVIEGIDKLVFEKAVARSNTFTKGGIVTIPAYNSVQFQLDTRIPVDGPFTEVWQVTRV